MPWPQFHLRRLFRRPRSGPNRAHTNGGSFHPQVEGLEQRLLLTINEFPVSIGSHPIGISSGPDGNIWFTEQDLDRIGVMRTDGTLLAEYPVRTAYSRPEFIVAGPDGNMWFTEQRAGKIGRITLDGTVTEFAVAAGSNPTFITAGPDGNLWFSEYSANNIGRITPGGTVTEFTVPTFNSHPMGITVGPDNNIWFTEFTGNKVGSLTLDGSRFTEYPIGTANSQPIGISTGWDGNLWFAEFRYPASKIGRMAADGSGFIDFDVPGSTSDVETVIAGPDGNMWYADSEGNKLGVVDGNGNIAEFATPTSSSGPLGLTLGPDQTDIWFAEIDSNQIGQYLFDGAPHTGGGRGALGVEREAWSVRREAWTRNEAIVEARYEQPMMADAARALNSGPQNVLSPVHPAANNHVAMDQVWAQLADEPLLMSAE